MIKFDLNLKSLIMKTTPGILHYAVIIAAFIILIDAGTYSFAAADINNFKFEVYTQDNGLPADFVTSIEKSDESDSVYIGTWGGLVKFDGSIISNITKTGRAEGIIPKNITCIHMDKTGVLWVGTIFYENAGLYRYQNGIFVRYSTLDGLPTNNISAITSSANGTIYIGTWGGGLVSFDGNKFSVKNKSNGLSDNYISSLEYNGQTDSLWAGTKFNGANLIKKDGSIEVYDDHTSSLVNNNVHKIAIDESQNITWFGTSGGISKFNGAAWQNIITGPQSISNNFIKSMFINNSIVYIVTNDGFSIFANERWENYGFSEKNNFFESQINFIYNLNDTIYLATDRGLYKIGRRN